MKFNKKDMLKRLTEKTTWLGIAGLIISYFGLEAMSAEQMSIMLASVAALFVAEDDKK